MIVSIIAAYVVQQFHGIMDYVQALFSIFVAPLLATILFWHVLETRHAAGRLPGPADRHHLLGEPVSWVKFNPAALATWRFRRTPSRWPRTVFRALWAFLFSAIVIVVTSLLTKPRPVAELEGLVYGATKLPAEEPAPWYKREWTWAIVAVVIFAALNIIFW